MEGKMNEILNSNNDEDSTEEEEIVKTVQVVVEVGLKCGALTSSGTKCKRRITHRGANCGYHTSVGGPSVSQIITVDKSQNTMINQRNVLSSPLQTFKVSYTCGELKSKGGKCKMKVSAKGKKCVYHDPAKFPYRDTQYIPGLLIIHYDWVGWGLTESSFMSRQLGIVIRQAPGEIKKDQPGWLYIFYQKDDEGEYYWKVGRTKKDDVKKRVEEWPGALICFARRVSFNKLAERLVFLILDNVRMLRHVYTGAPKKTSGKLYLSALKNDPKKLLEDALVRRIRTLDDDVDSFAPIPAHVITSVREDVKMKFGRTKTETEWVFWHLHIVKQVILSVKEALDDWKQAQELAILYNVPIKLKK